MTSPRRPAVKKAPVKKAAPRKRTTRKATVTSITPVRPEPLRPLGQEGTRLWNRIWDMRNRWISENLDIDHVTILCETVDERVSLRVRVFRESEWRDRVALRALDEQIAVMMGQLGLNPAERAKLNVSEEVKGKLAQMRASRRGGNAN